MKTNLWRDVPICVGVVMVLVPIFWPVPACGCSKIAAGFSNVKHLALGLVEYAGDHDDRYPDRDHWRDDIVPYLVSFTVRHDPSAPKGSDGYAFNGALSRAKAPLEPSRTPMVYDSVNPVKNASDLVTSLPSPGRHHGRDYIGYADGHVKGVAVPARP